MKTYKIKFWVKKYEGAGDYLPSVTFVAALNIKDALHKGTETIEKLHPYFETVICDVELMQD